MAPPHTSKYPTHVVAALSACLPLSLLFGALLRAFIPLVCGARRSARGFKMASVCEVHEKLIILFNLLNASAYRFKDCLMKYIVSEEK